MTDKEWQKKINKTVKYLQIYKEIFKECEEEYENRFGFNPSDADDDWWIDTMIYGNGGTELKAIIESAELRKDRRQRNCG